MLMLATVRRMAKLICNVAMIISVRIITTMIRKRNKRNDYVHNAELAELEARF